MIYSALANSAHLISSASFTMPGMGNHVSLRTDAAIMPGMESDTSACYGYEGQAGYLNELPAPDDRLPPRSPQPGSLPVCCQSPGTA